MSVIVLFYHGEPWIRNCIQSLEHQSLTRKKYEIIMVDNGGSTPSVDKYSKNLNTKVLHFPKNLGFAGGNNKALEDAEGDFVLLMNQDVVVHFNCLEELMVAFEGYPKAGVVSANMLMVSANNNISQHNSIQKTVGLYRLTLLGYASYLTIETHKNIVPVEFVSGNALCFRKSILDDVGNYLFDNRLGSYAEDLDLSIRLKHTQWEIYVRPNAVVYHYRDEAFSGNPVHKLRKLFRVSSNRLIVYYNNFSLSNFLKKLPALLLGIPFKVIRTDGNRKIQLFNFVVALGFLPIIFVYFGLRVIQISKTGKRHSDIPQKFSE